MKQIAVTEQELKWLIKHVNFQNNIKLYQKLISYVREEECVVTNKAYIINTLNEDKPQITEEYILHTDHTVNEEPLLAFHTKEQYFTDPVRHKIYFSEHGFIFYTDGKAIYSINRENGKTEITGYDNVKSSDCLLDIRHEVPYLKIQDEYFWPITGGEEKFNKELLEARIRSVSYTHLYSYLACNWS